MRLYFFFSFFFFSVAAFAQWPGDHFPFRPADNNPHHTIYLIPYKHPRLYKIAEGGQLRAWIENKDKGAKMISEGIIRIKKDSIILLDSRHSLYDFSKVELPEFHYFVTADSADWQVICPPDSIYKSKGDFHDFLRALEYRVKKQHQDWICAPFYHNMFKLNFSLLANLTIAISYEHRFNHDYALDMEAGIQFQGVPSSTADPMNMVVFPMWKQSGVIANAGMKYYFDKKGYIEPLMIYKYLTMSQARTGFPTAQKELLQDAYANHYGIALRVGTMTRMGGMLVDGYFGLGIKVMLIHQLAYGYYEYDDESRVSWYNHDHSPNVYNLVQYYPVINLGVKLGFGF